MTVPVKLARPRDLTIAEVCAELQLSRPTVYALIRSEQLPAYSVGTGRRYRVKPEDLEAYKARQRVARNGVGDDGGEGAGV
jgi:excisionase family DNA binding protein